MTVVGDFAASGDIASRVDDAWRQQQVGAPDLRIDPNGGLACRLPTITWNAIGLAPSPLRLVRGLLATAGTSLVYGAPATFKSFFALDLSLSVARGKPWRGLPVTGGPVLYIAAEGAHGAKLRAYAYRQRHGIEEDVPFAFVPTGINFVGDREAASLVIEACEVANADYRQPVALVVVDTLNRCFGGENENGTPEMGAFIQSIDRIREKTAAHVLVVHHAGKDPTKGARGNTALIAAVDTAIEISRQRGQMTGTAEVVKQRDGEQGQEYAFAVDPVELGTDEDGEPITSCVVRHPETAAAEAPSATDKIALAALHDALAQAGMTPAEAGQAQFVPPKVTKVVSRDVWRDIAYHQGLGKPGDKNRRKVFQRAVTKLKSLGLIGISGEIVWAVT